MQPEAGGLQRQDQSASEVKGLEKKIKKHGGRPGRDAEGPVGLRQTAKTTEVYPDNIVKELDSIDPKKDPGKRGCHHIQREKCLRMPKEHCKENNVCLDEPREQH